VWKGYKMKPFGHGQIGAGPRKDGILLAHRVSYAIHHGKPPAELCVCHKCDHGWCVNPKHLFLATKAANNKDMAVKGRCGKSTLTRQDALEIKRLRHETEMTLKEIGTLYGLSQSGVFAIASGVNWRYA
jgi:hypothetical protein